MNLDQLILFAEYAPRPLSAASKMASTGDTLGERAKAIKAMQAKFGEHWKDYVGRLAGDTVGTNVKPIAETQKAFTQIGESFGSFTSELRGLGYRAKEAKKAAEMIPANVDDAGNVTVDVSGMPSTVDNLLLVEEMVRRAKSAEKKLKAMLVAANTMDEQMTGVLNATRPAAPVDPRREGTTGDSGTKPDTGSPTGVDATKKDTVKPTDQADTTKPTDTDTPTGKDRDEVELPETGDPDGKDGPGGDDKGEDGTGQEPPSVGDELPGSTDPWTPDDPWDPENPDDAWDPGGADEEEGGLSGSGGIGAAGGGSGLGGGPAGGYGPAGGAMAPAGGAAAAAPGVSGAASANAGGMGRGMMPMGGMMGGGHGAGGEGGGESTWLTEDEDPFSAGSAAPPVIGMLPPAPEPETKTRRASDGLSTISIN